MTPEEVMILAYAGVLLIGVIFVFVVWHFSKPNNKTGGGK